MGSALKPGRQKRVKGQCPLRGQGAELPCGVWGNAPTVPRATSMPNALNKGAGSEASLPVTLRFRRSAPKPLHPQLAYCRAKWARPCSWSYNQSCSFAQAGVSRLRARPKGNENRRSLRSPFGNLRRGHSRVSWSFPRLKKALLLLEFYRSREKSTCGRETFHHCLVKGQPTR